MKVRSQIALRAASLFKRINLKAVVLGVALSLSFNGAARALDVDADDYSAGALPGGTNFGALYFQYADRNKFYHNGHVAGGGDLVSDVGILRFAHFVEIGPFLADPQFLLPIGGLNGERSQAPLGATAGMGDLILASTVWLYRDIPGGHFFGITPILYLPTGTYSANSVLNLGENRFKGGIQAGYVTPVFVKNLVLQLTADLTIYGNNSNYGALSQTQSQEPLAAFQGWLKYSVTKDLDLRLGSTYYVGGTTKINGVSNYDQISTANIRVGFAYNFLPGWNIMALYGRDVAVRNGFSEENRVNLRLYKIF